MYDEWWSVVSSWPSWILKWGLTTENMLSPTERSLIRFTSNKKAKVSTGMFHIPNFDTLKVGRTQATEGILKTLMSAKGVSTRANIGRPLDGCIMEPYLPLNHCWGSWGSETCRCACLTCRGPIEFSCIRLITRRLPAELFKHLRIQLSIPRMTYQDPC